MIGKQPNRRLELRDTVTSYVASLADRRDFAGVVQQYEANQALLDNASDPAAAEEALRQLTREAPEHALAHYLLGLSYSRLGDTPRSIEAFTRARDLDTMPWRATSLANGAVRRAAASGALLCDMQA